MCVRFKYGRGETPEGWEGESQRPHAIKLPWSWSCMRNDSGNNNIISPLSISSSFNNYLNSSRRHGIIADAVGPGNDNNNNVYEQGEAEER